MYIGIYHYKEKMVVRSFYFYNENSFTGHTASSYWNIDFTELSFWWNFHHWLFRKLWKWQLPKQPVMKISSKWWHLHFSERPVSDHRLDSIKHSSLIPEVSSILWSCVWACLSACQYMKDDPRSGERPSILSISAEWEMHKCRFHRQAKWRGTEEKM